MIRMTLALGAGLILAGAAFAQPPAAPAAAAKPFAPIPQNLLPARISGSGINVANLEAQKNWYINVMGMKLVRTYERGGRPYEYVLSYDPGNPQTAVLALIQGRRQEGATSYGRLILNVPDADALAAHLNANGVPTRRVAAGAFFLQDPERNNVEIYAPSQGEAATPAPAARGPAR